MNSAPQPGSTSATGTALEGLWVSTQPSVQALAFIDPAGNYFGFQGGSDLLTGAWSVTGSTWTFSSGSTMVSTGNSLALGGGLTGNGTFIPRDSFSGSYGMTMNGSGTANKSLSHTYSSANALSVTQADATGTWSAAGISLNIDPTGKVSGVATGGNFGNCSLNGTALLNYPGTSKNIYAINLTATSAATGTCNLDPALVHEGKAAITFTNINTTSSPVYQRSFTFLVARHASWFAGQLLKS